jgi:hypothetical protein
VLTVPEVVVVLHRFDRHDPAGALDLVYPDRGDADVADPPLIHVLLDRPEARLERVSGSTRCR